MKRRKTDWALSGAPNVEDRERILLTYEETGHLLRISKRTVERMVGRGELPIVRVGSAPRIRRVDLDAWIESSRMYLDASGREER